jgi:signal transduction histidine kinase
MERTGERRGERPGDGAGEPAYLAGPPLFWRLLAANLLVVLGGAVVGTTLTRQFVLREGPTALGDALTAVAAIGLSFAVSVAIMHQHVRLLEDSNRRLAAQRAELAEKTAELSSLAEQVLAAQEEERRRIARELHDDTMQSMAALIMGLERGLDAMPADQPHLSASHRTVARLRDVAVRILDDLRHLALDLRPAVLDDHGLQAALPWLARIHEERTGLPVHYEAQLEGDAARLPATTETALYRIVQEALSNVSKHARASSAAIRLHVGLENVTVEVEDDGVGFDPKAPRDGKQMGLFNMRERASLLGGAVVVARAEGDKGTLLKATVPRPATSPAQGDIAEAAGTAPPAEPRLAIEASR